jgi:hypothetical protein
MMNRRMMNRRMANRRMANGLVELLVVRPFGASALSSDCTFRSQDVGCESTFARCHHPGTPSHLAPLDQGHHSNCTPFVA